MINLRIKKQKTLSRCAGVLIPLSSLPSDQGIGSLGKETYKFIDFLHSAGQSCWQVLPLVPTGYGDSPYQSCSSFAGSILYIDMHSLADEGLIDRNEISQCCGKNKSCVDYIETEIKKSKLLEKAYYNSTDKKSSEYINFCDQNSYWLEDYAAFMAIRRHFDNKPWYEWRDDIKFRNETALNILKDKLHNEIEYYKFCQFIFYKQWQKLKKYANDMGIQIIGDIPIYVALDSADVWASPELFQLDGSLIPTAVAGVPPDMFSATGQLWGNPLFDWNAMESQGFQWWKRRIFHNTLLYDMIRIDHFIGILNYYSVPYGEATAENGTWKTGPGEKLINAISLVTGDKKIIAEDLGIITTNVIRVLKKSGYPGMKLMEFGFDGNPLNESLPHMFEKNCIVYGGTHDNETLTGFFLHQKSKTINFAQSYLNVHRRKDISWGIIRSAYASIAVLAIFQLQDYMELDNSARINTPSTIGGNWCWRLTSDMLTDELAEKIKKLTVLYGR